MEIEPGKRLDPMLGEAEQDLMNLVDLQRFLAEELSESVDITTDFSKSFTPITTGLGFNNTRPKSNEPLRPFPAELPSKWAALGPIEPKPDFSESFLPEGPLERSVTPPAQKKIARVIDDAVSGFGDEAVPIRRQESKLKRALGDRTEELPPLTDLSEERRATPPPLPRAGWIRRVMSGVMDQVFVWTLAILAVLFVSKVVGVEGTSPRQLRELARPEMVRSMLWGFSAIWVAYLTVSMGLLEATFGMWIWGMRIDYGSEQRLLKKFVRIALSFLMEAPLVPSILLLIQKGGKNLIDSLSGSQILRTQR